MVALCPFVPGIHEHDALITFEGVEGTANSCSKPTLVQFWGRTVEDRGVGGPPRGVVPTGSHTSKPFVGCLRLVEHSTDERFIGVEAVSGIDFRNQAEPVQPMQGSGAQIPSFTLEYWSRQDVPVWRELYGSVKADSMGIHIVGEALDSGEVEVSNACSVGPFPPDLRRSRGIWEEF